GVIQNQQSRRRYRVNMEITSLEKECESRASHEHPALPETASSRRSERGRQCDESVKKRPAGIPFNSPHHPGFRHFFLIIDHPSMLPASCPPSTTSSC